MKTRIHSWFNIGRKLRSRRYEQGNALPLTVFIGMVGLATLSGTLSWCITNARLIERHNQYFRTIAAAEAATEKVLSSLAADYRRDAEPGTDANMGNYRTMTPTASENSYWANYEFNNAQGTVSRNYVELADSRSFRVLSSQYRGLNGYATTIRVISNAREINSQFNIPAAVMQDVEIATIPLFQFAIFYNIELEVNPGANMTISGPVHCNTNIYVCPSATLTFQSDVTAAGKILRSRKPGDPTSPGSGAVNFNDENVSGVSSLTLPIGTDNSPAAVHKIVEVPPAGESATSAIGQQRYYNKADMVIRVSDAGVQVTSGLVNNFATVIPSSQYNTFMRTDLNFYNKREAATVQVTEIDVNKLKLWNATNILLRPVLTASGGDLKTVYVVDSRTETSTKENGVRLVNGQTLPPKGLTVATPNAVYIKGHYNADSTELGLNSTTKAKPASIIADAVTILSANWNDANSTLSLSSRTATDTTVNAAFLAGVVETVTGSYSGGVENFPRFLETWSGRTFTYNGSMVVMFPSQEAIGLWRGTGSTIGIYDPPTRKWAFDLNFRDPAKVPPGAPSIRALVRAQWSMIKPNSTTP